MVALASPDPGPARAAAFATFLSGPGGLDQRRSLSLLGAAALHAMAAAAAILLAGWPVDELEAKRVVLTFPGLPLPSAAPAAAPTRRDQPTPRRSTTARRRLTPRPSPVLAPRPPSTAIDRPASDQDPSGDDLVDPGSNGQGQACPPGATCSGSAPAPRMLPPRVGEKRCLACPLPHLPPAYQRLGATVAILARLCADARGNTTRVDILRGLSDDVDRQVAAVLARWRFHPLELEGRPVPFCYVSRFVFTSN